MTVYSHSRLSTFEQCPLKFKYRYIDKIKPDFEKSIESHLGTAVHNTLEWIYNKILEKKPVPTIDQMISYYSKEWQKEFEKEIKIVKNNLTPSDYFNKGIKFLLDYYIKHSPFQDGTLECEKKVVVEIHGHKLQGFIDRFSYNENNGEYEIHDYKTANMLPTQEKMDKDRQLALYSIAIQESMDAEKICLTWHYLAHNKKIISRRTNEQIEELKNQIKELIEIIESTTEFPAKKSALCGWCEYKSICPKFSKTQKTKQENIENYPTAKKYLRD